MSAETNSRTARALRDEGYRAEIVERHIPTRPHPTKADLFGWCDVLGVRDGETIAVQACRATDFAQHVRDLVASGGLRLSITAGWRCELWVWRLANRKWVARRMQAQVDGDAVTFVEGV